MEGSRRRAGVVPMPSVLGGAVAIPVMPIMWRARAIGGHGMRNSGLSSRWNFYALDPQILTILMDSRTLPDPRRGTLLWSGASRANVPKNRRAAGGNIWGTWPERHEKAPQ